MNENEFENLNENTVDPQNDFPVNETAGFEVTQEEPVPDAVPAAPEAPAQPEYSVGEFAAVPRTEETGRVDGEYSFTRPEAQRSAYSDAGYVASNDAAAVPRSYHCSASTEKKHREKRAKRGVGFGGVIAACLVCAILGGIVGGIVPGLLKKDAEPAEAAQAADPAAKDSTVITVASSGATNPVTTAVVSSGKELSATEIYYNLAVNQVVGVKTEITYTNYFGYTTSSAVSGSGFIISTDGYILTNNHVIADAVEGGYDVKVLTYDGTEHVATVVGYEEDNDVAVLKIDAEGLSAATIGDSDNMLVGQTVYAVGNPLGELEYTMTDGMVSALDREITSQDSSTGATTTINMFQISAAINSGNSGGPVYNSRGEVIGIATAKYSSTGVEGLGFAIPINDAVKIANDLISDGYVRGKAYMGINVGTVSASAAQYYGLVQGAIVSSVSEGSCAEKAGLQSNDIITAMDDTEIASKDDLVSAKKNYSAGDSCVLTVNRGGETLELTITFDEETPELMAADQETAAQQDDTRMYGGSGSSGSGGYGGYGGGYSDYYDFFSDFFGSSPFGR